jgi:hypothetical protein
MVNGQQSALTAGDGGFSFGRRRPPRKAIENWAAPNAKWPTATSALGPLGSFWQL